MPPTEIDPIELCQSPAEVILVGDRICGRAIVKWMVENVDPNRESLMRAARELKRGKAPADLVEMVKQAAKTALVSKRRTFGDMVRRRQRRACKK
jgi:hypothetical protein